MAKNLSPSEATKRLGIGMPRIYGLLASGKLPALKRDGHWEIPESAVSARQRQVAEWRRNREVKSNG